MTLKFEEIYPKIFVYKNPFKDLNLLKKVIIESEQNPEGSILGDWKGWYTFGKETNMLNFDRGTDSERNKQEKEMWDDVREVFYLTTQHYSEIHNVPIEKDKIVHDSVEDKQMNLWQLMGPSICKYEVEGGIDDNSVDLAMHMHTDYQQEYENHRGYKFTVTCTMYLNDNYEGGGLEFLVGDNKLFYYKPKAGDVLVFPAGDPNYLSEPGELYRHGVKKVYGNPKYFIRNHWQRYYLGSKEWLDQESIYGKDVWQQMESERTKQERKEGKYQTLDYDYIYKNAERIK